MVAFGHHDDRGIGAFLGLDGVKARLVLLEGPRRVQDLSAGGVGGGGEGGGLCPQQ